MSPLPLAASRFAWYSFDMGMPIEKARDIVREYKKTNYNASEALQNVGYAESTANHQSKVTINSAIKTVIKNDMEAIVNSGNPMQTMFDYLHLTAEDVAQEFLKIIKQDKDMTNKLKALQPLLATQGIKWNDDNKQSAPALHLTVKQSNGMAQQGHEKTVRPISIVRHDNNGSIASEDVDSLDLDDNNIHLTNSQENAMTTPQSRFETETEKEVGRPTQNFVDSSTIDKSEEVLPLTISPK